MTNIDDNIFNELEEVDYFNDKIECEMNSLLFESDCALINAESELIAISDEDSFIKIEQDIENNSDTSGALSIEVSNDIFKELASDTNLSIINSPSTDNLDDQNVTKNSPGLSINDLKNSSDSDEGNNSVIDLFGSSSLEITITNDVDEDLKELELETTLLNNSLNFEGCSKQFSTNGVEEKITVIVDIENIPNSTTISRDKITEDEHLNCEIAQTSEEIKLSVQKEIIVDINSNQEKENCKINTNDSNDKEEIAINDISKKRPFIENSPECIEKKTKIDQTKENNLDENSFNFDYTQTQFTQAIFDPDETADANDPKWSEINKNLNTIEDHFLSVRDQWRSMALPNPHKNLTRRFVPANLKHKSKPTTTVNENACTSCVSFLDNRISKYTQQVNSLYAQLDRLPRTHKGRSQGNKITKEIDHLQKLVIEIVKNREEIKQNFTFYSDQNGSWNANYLTRTDLKEFEAQDQLLEFQMKFYNK